MPDSSLIDELLADARERTGKSVDSNSGRSSISPSLKGTRLVHSMASSNDFARIRQKPAISFFVSVKGPSVIANFPLA